MDNEGVANEGFYMDIDTDSVSNADNLSMGDKKKYDDDPPVPPPGILPPEQKV